MIQIEGKDKLIFVGDTHGEFDTLRYMHEYEVIGNIYENRELITCGDLDEYWIQRWKESRDFGI